MNTRNFVSFLVALIALVTLLPAASAFVDIEGVYVDGIIYSDGETAGVFAGDTIGVRPIFTALEDEDDVRVTARILGEPGLSEVTERFDVIENSTYRRLLNIQTPFDLNDNLNEPFVLEITIESNAQSGDEVQIFLEIQRENNLLEILSVESKDEVRAGDNLALDVVVKNRGRDKARDTFVQARIPALGVSRQIFLDDLYAQDHEREDEEDAALGRLFLMIPRDAQAGVYNIEIEAFNDDASVLTTRKVVVVGSGASSDVITSMTTKTFPANTDGMYTLTIVNADDRIKVYELIVESTSGLSVSLEESLVAVPAGSSKTVRMTAHAIDTGNYNFAVNVHSDGELVERQNFVANVDGRSSGTGTGSGNAAVVLTIILAIIFVVLLIVLIVLLTRKPEKKEDFGESYY